EAILDCMLEDSPLGDVIGHETLARWIRAAIAHGHVRLCQRAYDALKLRIDNDIAILSEVKPAVCQQPVGRSEHTRLDLGLACLRPQLRDDQLVARLCMPELR